MSFGFGFGLPQWQALSAGFNPISLFAGGVNGAFYDPSDLTTLFTTSAGTTPVAMPGQGSAVVVGRMLDKSGNGNHAIAFNDTTARPELSARVNQLLNSENFSGAGWTVDGISLTASAGTAPDGTNTATSAVLGTGSNRVFQFDNTGVLGNKIFSIYVKPNAGSTITISAFGGASPSGAATINASTGVVTGFTGASSVPVGNGWYRVFLPVNVTAASGNATYWLISGPAFSVFIWGAQLVSTNQFPANTYQRIADQYTYNTSGFPLYLRFDGVDDSMYTPANLNLSGTDKVTVFAGVRKLSDAAQGAVAELSATIASNNGAFLLSAPNSAAANYNFSSKGTTQVDNTVITYAAPNTAVLSGAADITAPSNILRVNAVQAGSVGTSQGTGNFGTYPLYIGSRNNASLRFNGHLYSLAVVGSAVSAGNISATEQWVAQRTGIVIP